MVRGKIPETRSDLTPEWLTEALRFGGALREARVVGVEAESLGEGQGFMGDIARLRLRLDRQEDGAPVSLIAKLPTSVGANRGLGQVSGAYEREIRFYRDLSRDIGLRIPKHYYSDMDEQPGARYGLAIFDFLDALPRGLLRPLMRLLIWLSRFGGRPNVLLIEDLAPARVGDQVAGCSREEAKRALRSIARLHARFWNSPDLEDWWWIAPIDVGANLFQLYFEDASEAFAERYRERLGESSLARLEWLRVHGPDLAKALGRLPATLLHGDFRLDNLCFDDASGEAILFDWQGSLRGPGAFDVAYFLSGALEPDASREEEGELLRFYHGELAANGVSDHPFELCELAYGLSMLLMLHRVTVTVSEIFELGEDRGVELMDTWISRILGRLERVHPDGLLAGVPDALSESVGSRDR